MDYKLYNNDCIEAMKGIQDGSINLVLTDEKIVELYLSGESMRNIAKKFNTNHKLISRILNKANITTRPSKNTRYARKFNCSIERKYSNVLTHLQFSVDLMWLMKFSDFEKLKFLNASLTNRDKRWDESSEWYIAYIERFYFDK